MVRVIRVLKKEVEESLLPRNMMLDTEADIHVQENPLTKKNQWEKKKFDSRGQGRRVEGSTKKNRPNEPKRGNMTKQKNNRTGTQRKD